MTEGEMTAWVATAQALAEIDTVELEFLPDFAESIHAPTPAIGSVPGAFNADVVGLSSTAITVFSVVVACMKYIAPKLFDAAIDMGKESFKRNLEKRGASQAPSSIQITSADSRKIHEFIRLAAIERHLSAASATSIANSVIAQIAMIVKE